MNQPILNAIHTTGYCILKNQLKVSSADLSELFAQINHSSVAIFNHDWDNNDKKRMQRVLQKEKIGFIHALDDVVNRINPNLTQSTWVIIKSDAGCKKQMAHLDYVPTAEFSSVVKNDTSFIPLLVLVGVMDNTYIHIWENSIAITNETYDGPSVPSTKILLNKGDVLVFRSDVIHAGSEYDELNIRLHCYLDSPKVARDEDTTFIISLDAPATNKIIVE